MSNIAQVAAYAAAFEKAFENDDWTEVGPFFAEEAIYHTGSELFMGGHIAGRSGILEYFKSVLDRFDRRFESRELALMDGPHEEGNTVRIRGSATYRAAGVPDLVLVLEEIITYEDGLIVHIEDCYSDEMKVETEDYIDQYGEKLGLGLHP
jgi:hypothetical protein